MAAKTRVQRCLCREVDGIWQYRTGGNLTIFDKDHDTAEEGRSQVRQKQSSCSQAYGFATITCRRFGVPKRNQLFFQGVTALCTTSFTPPSGKNIISLRYAGSPNRHQLYIVIVANACACTQGPFWLPWRIILVG